MRRRAGMRARPSPRGFGWLLLLAASGAGLHSAASGQPPRTEDPIYGYTDDHGRLVHVPRLEDIPLRLRPHARRVDLPEEASVLDLLDPAVGKDRATVYRYTTPDGRVSYTNLGESVPASQRSAAKLDLSHVSLNSEIGRELEQRLRQEHERLLQQPVCQQLRAAADKPWFRVAWDDHAPWLVTGGAILSLLLATPFMLRRVGGREWARTLSMAMPVLAGLGLFAYVVVRSGRAVSAAQEQAMPCRAGTWDALAKGEAGLVRQVHLLQGLRAQQRTLEQIAEEGR